MARYGTRFELSPRHGINGRVGAGGALDLAHEDEQFDGPQRLDLELDRSRLLPVLHLF